MKIPNFTSDDGAILYQNTVGRLISPRVADVLLTQARADAESHDILHILDLGCGPGTISIPLGQDHPHISITAVDSSESMIAVARSEAEKRGVDNIDFHTMDAGHIALEPQSFDLVLCNLAFPFFPRPTESMEQVFVVMRPGATVYFTVPGRNTWDEFFTVAASVLGDMISMAKPFLSKFTRAELLPGAMLSAGFTDCSEQRILLPFHFERGQNVLDFFTELFHLLDYATPDMKSELADAIDRVHPEGFTMHYEVVLLSARRP